MIQNHDIKMILTVDTGSLLQFASALAHFVVSIGIFQLRNGYNALIASASLTHISH